MKINPKDTMLIFDLDGTLWDSSENVAESWNIVLKKKAPALANITPDDIKAVMGKTMAEIADILFAGFDDETKKSLAHACERFEVEYIGQHGGKFFEGIKETVSTLFDAEFKMAIVSNCQTGYIGAFLNSMEMTKYFCDLEEWGATKMSKSHNIKLVMERCGFEKAVYVGDTEKDMNACIEAKIPFIHAAYGFGNIAAPVEKINSFPELLDILGVINNGR